MTDPQPTQITPTEQLLTAEFHRLTDFPPEIEWFANLRNRSTRRAYEHAIHDFMRFTGIARPDEFRTVTRAHVIAWRDDLARREIHYDAKEEEGAHSLDVLSGATVRHRLAAAVVAVRISLREERRHPQPGQSRQATAGRERRRRDAGDRRPPGTRPARRAGDKTVKAKRDRAILSTLLFYARRREEPCKLKVRAAPMN
jgi:integrase/recombinase XerD